MARFNQPPSNVPTETTTHEGGVGYRPSNPAVELLFTAACTLAGEDTFYETSEQRNKRLVDLVHSATKHNAHEVADIARRLRSDFKIRTASILVACEYVAAGGPNARSVIDSVCQRADEPGEVLAYWTATHGRKIHRGIKLGLQDAAQRLYKERNILKYDTPSHAFRFGDVIELCHFKPEDEDTSRRYKYLLDQRHHNDGDVAGLHMLERHKELSLTPEGERRQKLRDLGVNALGEGGYTWEALSSWLPGGMDAEAWEAVIPSMGVMALVRNLRNFDQANISAGAVNQVINRITDPDQVEKSRIFPYQVLLAYQNAPSDNWKRALGDTVDLASGNLPRLDGSVLCIDTSGSMQAPLSRKGTADRVTVAGLQAASVARHSRDCEVVIYGQGNLNITSEVRGRSVLGAAEYIHSSVGRVGHSTYGHTAVRDNFDPAKHTRAILFTDDQQHDSGSVDLKYVPQIVTFNVGGYGVQSTYGKGRLTVAGFSDAIFDSVAKILQIEATQPTGTTV